MSLSQQKYRLKLQQTSQTGTYKFRYNQTIEHPLSGNVLTAVSGEEEYLHAVKIQSGSYKVSFSQGLHALLSKSLKGWDGMFLWETHLSVCGASKEKENSNIHSNSTKIEDKPLKKKIDF